MQMGIERLVVKHGKMVIYFISNPNSSFYASPIFTEMLKFVQKQVIACRMSERNEKLTLAFVGVENMERVTEITSKMCEYVLGK